MSASSYFAAKRAQFRSGFCGISNPPDSHARCKGDNGQGKPCACKCHREPEKPAGRAVTEQATEILDAAEYLSPAWYEQRRTSVSASEVAAILGLSPWQSAFDLWWLKRTGETSESENRAQRRGRRYEALILEDFADEHPEFHVAPVGLVRNNERPWQTCTPDGLVLEMQAWLEDEVVANEHDYGPPSPLAVIEAKTAGSRDGWGEPGTDGIPVYYRTQVLWQMDTLGLNVAYVPVRFGFDYAEYVVEYDEADVTLMREAAETFLESVREDRMPDPDSHKATTRRLKRLHPELVDDEVPVPATLVRQYQRARALRNAAQDRMRLAENRVRTLLGPASHGVIDLGGQTKRFSHTRSDIKERTQTVAAHTRDVINFPRKDL